MADHRVIPETTTAVSPELTRPAVANETRRWRLRPHIRLWTKRLLAIAAPLSTALIAAWFLVILGGATLRRHTVEFELLSVPKTLADDGLTSQVMTQRLLDAVKKVNRTASSGMKLQAYDLPLDLSGITIPRAGISIDRIAASIRALLPDDWRRRISGEFTQAHSDLELRLRLNGIPVFTATETGAEAADRLIKRGALAAITELQPYVTASYLYQSDKEAAKAEANRIIATLSPPDENAIYAHNLRGLLAQDQGKTDEAIAEFRTAANLDPTYAWPHNNLGNIWRTQGKTDDAIAEYRTAIKLDPTIAWPHSNLGVIWRDQGKTNDAIAEFRTAIRLDPKFAYPHYGLGLLLIKAAAAKNGADKAQQLGSACNEFRAAAQFAPANPSYAAQMKKVQELLGNDSCRPPDEGGK